MINAAWRSFRSKLQRVSIQVALSPTTSGKSKVNTPRLKRRRRILEKVFSPSAMEKAWTKYVRAGLRSQEVVDLHDYNDFHWGRVKYFDSLRSEIINGTYTAKASTPIRVEKSNGVTRTLVVPSVQDAIVLQCLVEYILERVLKVQPSKNSFFSRSHGFSGGEFSFDSQYIWFRRWKKFSSLRFSIASTHEFVCTTDIANYYDNIDYTHLRWIMSSVAHIEEVVMDVIFRVLSEISWRPDYLPPPARSLPQVHFDAPRLLAHAYLYEVDEFLKDFSKDSFVRWVDDITIAVNSREDGKRLLRDLDQILMTRGLRLNAGKTKILSAKEAEKFFHKKENAYLDVEIRKSKDFCGKPGRLKILSKRASANFDKFYKNKRFGHWDKIVKRYFTLFLGMRDSALLKYCGDIIRNHPAVRESVWRCLAELGPSSRAFDEIESYLTGADVLDDASVFQAADVLVEWRVSPNSSMHKKIVSLSKCMMDKKYDERSEFYFIAGLRLLAKYGFAKGVFEILNKEKDRWSSSEVRSRQVAAILPKIRKGAWINSITKIILANKFPSSSFVVQSLERISSRGSGVPKDIRLYVLNGMNVSSYGIDRFIIALHVLMSKGYAVKSRSNLRDDLLKYVNDPIYLKVIKSIKLS